jgi:hypothetical protein
MTKKPTLMSDRDVIYLAGLFDGEGCFSVYGHLGIAHKGETKRERISYKAAVQMMHYEVLHWAWQTTGLGRLYYYDTEKRRARNYLPVTQWNLYGLQAAALARLLLPYLRVKKEQAGLLIELSELRARSKPNACLDRARQWEIAHQMSELNSKKGKNLWKTNLILEATLTSDDVDPGGVSDLIRD